MKKIYLPVSFLIIGVIIFYIARSQYKPPYGGGNPGCIENPNLYEDWLIPTKADSIEFTKQDSFKRYRLIGGGDLDYYSLPLVRGLIDTTLFASAHWDQFNELSKDVRYHAAYSPLIIEGEVEQVLNEDTATKKTFILPTVFIIKVIDVISSKYKIKKGDYVTARTSLYGYKYSEVTKEVVYQYVMVRQYTKGKRYLFMLNKYSYMSLLNNFRNQNIADVYCPYSFILGITEHNISEDYDNKQFSKEALIKFLKSKK